MSFLRRLIHHMALDIEAFKTEIAGIHSNANVAAEVTASVHTSIDTALAPVLAAQTASDARIDTLETAIKTLADQLTAGDSTGALATAQAAVPVAPVAEPSPAVDPAPASEPVA